VRRGTALDSGDATPARNWSAPTDGDRSRLLLGNEKHSFLRNFPGGQRIGRAHSIAGIEARERFLSLTIAALLGVFVGKRWSGTAVWVWTLPVVFFGLGALLYSTRPNGGLLAGGGFAEHFFVPNCFANPHDCRDFFVFRGLLSSSPAFVAFPKPHGLNSTLDLTKFARRRSSCWKISISTHSESWDANTTNSESPLIDSRPSGFAMVTRASMARKARNHNESGSQKNPRTQELRATAQAGQTRLVHWIESDELNNVGHGVQFLHDELQVDIP
jgi:hypothetical protein